MKGGEKYLPQKRIDHRPEPTVSIDALERDVIGMLFLVLDGKEIGTTIGYKQNGD